MKTKMSFGGAVALILLAVLPSMAASIPGVPVTGPIVPRDTADTYPTHHDVYGKGGYRAVANPTERDAIPVQRRAAGMLVGVLSEGLIYQLSANLTNWTVVVGGSGSTNGTSETLYVATVGVLTNLPPIDGALYMVLGEQYAGDWGDARPWRWDPTNTITASAIRRHANGVATGRYVHDWNDRDARAFGVRGYDAPEGPVPWIKNNSSAAIGTGDFSFWVRFIVPAPSAQSVGLLSVNRAVSVDGNTDPLNASLEVYRGSGTEFSILLRATNSSSSGGSTLVDAAKLQASNALIDAFAGTAVDLVVTRTGVTWLVYLNGVDVTASFTVSNSAGLGKSIGSGALLDWTLGTTIANDWIWPSPITKFALWSMVLSPAQAANPQSTSGKVIDYSVGPFADMVDQAPYLNAAIAEASASGGGDVRVPARSYWIASTIRMRNGVNLVGESSGGYPASGNRPARSGATEFVAANGFIGDMVSVHRDYADPRAPFLSPRDLWALGNGTAYSRLLRGSIRNIAFNGSMAWASRGVMLDRIGGFKLKDLSFWHLPGSPIYGAANNAIEIAGIWAQTHRGYIFRSLSDAHLQNVWLDGAAGPALWSAGNGVQVGQSTFEFSRNPRSAPAFEVAASFDAASDVITVANHRYLTGDPVRFLNEGGALPTGLSATLDYFVIRTGSNTFKVSLKYIDEDTGGGSLNGGDVVDFSSAGTGTSYVTVAPSVGLLVQGDGNSFIGVNARGSWESAAQVETFGENSFIGGNYNLSGYNNPARTNGTIGAFRLISSPANRIIGVKTDDRENAAASQFGIIADASSRSNAIVANSFDVAYPYQLSGSGNFWIDGSGIVAPFDGGAPRIYLPSSPTYAKLTPVGITNTSTIQFARDAQRLHVWNQDTSSDFYAPLLPSESTQWAWRGAANGAMTMANNGAGAGLFFISGAYHLAQMHKQVNSTTAGDGWSELWVRNRGANSSTFAAVQAGDTIAYPKAAAFFGTGPADYQTVGGIRWTAIQNQSPSSAHALGQMMVTGTNSTTLQAAFGWSIPPAGPDTGLEVYDPVTGLQKRLRIDPVSRIVHVDTLTNSASGGGSATNATAVSVDGAYTSTINLADGGKVSVTRTGTNVVFTIVTASLDGTELADGVITTNKLLAAAHAALRSPDFGTGLVVGRSARFAPVALGAGTTLNWTTNYTVTLTANRTVSFGGTPAEGDTIRLYVIAGANCVLTFPSALEVGGTSISSVLIQNGRRYELSFVYQGGEVSFAGAATADNWAASTNPTATNDVTQGYAIGSRWRNGTNSVWMCVDNTTSAAIWYDLTKQGTVTSVQISGGTTGLSFAGGPVTGSGTFTLSGTLAAANIDAAMATDAEVTTAVGPINGATDTFILLDEHSSAPATPAAGKIAVYGKQDGKVYRKDDAGTEAELGGGGSGSNISTNGGLVGLPPVLQPDLTWAPTNDLSFVLAHGLEKASWWYTAYSGSTTLPPMLGDVNNVNSGTPSTDTAATGHACYVLTNPAGNSSGFSGNSFHRTNRRLYHFERFRLTTTTDVRWFVGFTSDQFANQLTNTAPPFAYAGILYDTSASHTNWMAVSSDGTNVTSLATGSLFPTNALSSVRFLFEPATRFRVYFGDTLVANITSNLMPAGLSVRWMNGARPLVSTNQVAVTMRDRMGYELIPNP